MTMDSQRLSILGRTWAAENPQLQQELARVHDSAERPRCLCVPGGVEMYVARHRRFVVKRMPDTGHHHHSGCPSYEPESQQSGLGDLLGEAVLETEPGAVDLRVDFPWARLTGRGAAHGDGDPESEVGSTRRRMSMRALMHFLFERAGFNRWSPAMEGKRNQGVLHKYLLEAAENVSVKGLALSERLYVPEPFNESTRTDAARRRRDKLAVLRPREGNSPLALVLGEFKASEATERGCKVWIKHMPDAPLLVASKTWARIERVFAPMFEARDADMGHRVRLILISLVRARREYTYEIDAASLMMTSEHWIPVEAIHELPLIHALVEQRRRFVKPLRYDAATAAGFPNALLLDMGSAAVPLHVLSAFMSPKERVAKQLTLSKTARDAWVWLTDGDMPPFPKREMG